MKCPFCGVDHEVKPHLNIICKCGGKYYFHSNEWWNRRTGERRIEEKPITHCKDCFLREKNDQGVMVCTGPMAYAATPDEWFCAGGTPKKD